MAEHEDNILIKLIKLKVRKWVIICAVIVILIVIICASSLNMDLQNALLPGSTDDEDYTEFCPLAYFNSIYVTEKGTLMAETTVQSVWDNDDRYSQYLTDVNSLAYLLNAQVVTQYPYIESASSKDLNGTVKFYRNDSYTPMKYVSESELDKYINDYNKNGNYESQDKALESFSLNKDGTIKIAYLQEEEDTITTNNSEAAAKAEDFLFAKRTTEDGEYIVSKRDSHLYSTNIAYKSLIQNYSLPFELLWSIVVMGDDGSSSAGNSEDLAHAIASMAYDGEIRLIIDDNNNVTTTTDRYTYNIQQKSIYKDIALSLDSRKLERHADYETNPEIVDTCNVTHVNVQTVNSPTVKIGLIESWCAVYKNDAKFDSTDKTGKTEKNEANSGNSEWKEIDTKSRSWQYNSCPISGIKNKFDISDYQEDIALSGQTPVITSTEHIHQRYYNLNQTTQVGTSSFSYTNGTVTSPAFNKDIADLFNVSSFYSVKSYLCNSGNGYFMEAIEGNTTTANMVDLINYIFNQITETKSYYKGKGDFESIWNDINFTPSTEIYGGTIQEKVWFALKGLGYSDIAVAGAMGNIHYESGTFDPTSIEHGYTENTGGIGICQWTNNNRGTKGRNAQLQAYAKSKGTTWQDENTQVEFLVAELTKGGGANGYASYELGDMRKYYGVDIAYAEGWIGAKTVEDATRAFCYSFERPSASAASESLPRRIELALQYYNQFKGKTQSAGTSSDSRIGTIKLSGEKGTKMKNMLVEALRIADDDKYKYSQELRNTEFYYDCSSFVKRLYSKFFNFNAPNTTSDYPDYNKYCIITGDPYTKKNSLQPGDVLWRSGHVGIYLGNGQYVHASGVKKGICVSTLSKESFSKVYRFIK